MYHKINQPSYIYRLMGNENASIKSCTDKCCEVYEAYHVFSSKEYYIGKRFLDERGKIPDYCDMYSSIAFMKAPLSINSLLNSFHCIKPYEIDGIHDIMVLQDRRDKESLQSIKKMLDGKCIYCTNTQPIIDDVGEIPYTSVNILRFHDIKIMRGAMVTIGEMVNFNLHFDEAIYDIYYRDHVKSNVFSYDLIKQIGENDFNRLENEIKNTYNVINTMIYE